jgi:hypothetical protein
LTSAVAGGLQIALLATLASLGAGSIAAEMPATRVRPMTQRELDRLLKTRVSIALRAAPVGEALAKLAAGTGLPMVLDRRVDRGRVADLPAREAALLDTITELASNVDARPVAWNGLLYVGPRGAGERLATLSRERRRDVAGVSPARRGRFGAVTSATWKRLAEPREIVRDRLQSAGLRLDNPDAIPHDVWDAGSLPPMSLADQLTIVLVQFDLQWTPRRDGERVRIDPIVLQ